ncbi:GH18 family chitinase [Sinobacterium caligoides]|uniref:chitinase n=1 Tax=Sinobacterium caligoides TaxID=933926 RepID=A0A3N2D577_9GAMM|nr:glycosyl hydrolase family 18 protein [Sinobacterium caligoides]ROR94937.1 GH18 family chitinase [Sinobacterium caligoides]
MINIGNKKQMTGIALIVASSLAQAAYAVTPPAASAMYAYTPLSINNFKVKASSGWSTVPDFVCWSTQPGTYNVGCSSDIDFDGPVPSGIGSYDINKTIPPELLQAGENTIYVTQCESSQGWQNCGATFEETFTLASNFDYENTTSNGTGELANLTKDKIPYATDSNVGAEAVTAGNDKVVAGYVSEWAQYDRGYDLEKLEPTAYTDLIYSFFGICGDLGVSTNTSVDDVYANRTLKAEDVANACKARGLADGSIVMIDGWGGLQNKISARQKDSADNTALYHGGTPLDFYEADGTKITKNYLNAEQYNLFDKTNAMGLMGQLIELKSQNPNLNVSVSIGGWSLSEPYHRIAASPELTDVFAQSIVDFAKKWSFVGGFDIDWEFPGSGGASNAYSADDGDNFVTLVKAVRAKLDANGLDHIKLSSAVGASTEHINQIGKDNYKALVSETTGLDRLYLMNYDYWGAAFSTTLGHQSNLFGNSLPGNLSATQNSADKAIKLLESYDVPASKIVIGVANYSRGKNGVIVTAGEPGSADTSTIGNDPEQFVYGTYEDSILEGYDLFEHIAGANLLGDKGFSLYTDKTANADYYYNSGSGVYYSIDTPRTAALKAHYANENGLAGAFVWTVEYDYKGQTVNTLNEALGKTITSEMSAPGDRALKASTCGINVDSVECETLNNQH